jgi:hypothetical protein
MKSSRSTNPRRWTSLVITSAALGLGIAQPSFGQMIQTPALGHIAPSRDALLWTVQAEGGEGGEAGAVEGASPDVAYLAQLSLVEGHIAAALALYAKGQVDEAIGLSYHPEAEMMDTVRENLLARNVADITPAMTAFSLAMEESAPLDVVTQAFVDVQLIIKAARAPLDQQLRVRFDAITLLARAAADEYASSTADGTVGDVMAYHESFAFIATARLLATELDAIPATKAAAEKALIAMQSAQDAFGDMTSATLEVRDPAILLSVAARLELIASSIR